MTTLTPCPSCLVLVARPAEFSQLCQSVLASDPVYGPLMRELAGDFSQPMPALRFQDEHADEPFLLSSKLQGGSRIHHS